MEERKGREADGGAGGVAGGGAAGEAGFEAAGAAGCEAAGALGVAKGGKFQMEVYLEIKHLDNCIVTHQQALIVHNSHSVQQT